MNLVIDVGNTRTKLGIFDNNFLNEKAVWQDWTLDDLNRLTKGYQIENVILSAVKNVAPEIVSYLKNHYNFIELTAQTPIPFRNQYKTPETLGKDRIAAAAAAKFLFPRQTVLIVDCGTCIKYDVVSPEGIYKGGNIAPGISMRLKAMHHFTAKLPEVELRVSEDTVGYSTETALQNGAFWGAKLEIEGFSEHFREIYRRLRVIVTGGDAEILIKHLKIKNMFYDPDIVLKGLNIILRHNLKGKEQ